MKTISHLLSLLLLASYWATPAVLADDKKHEGHAKHEKHGGHEAHAGHMLKGYVSVADALYKDDLAAAKKAAIKMTEHDEESMLSKPSEEVGKAKDIKAARESFKKLSAEAVKLAKMHKKGGYTVMVCPMVKDGKGVWLSADGKVNNPYFGSKMPHCGKPMKE